MSLVRQPSHRSEIQPNGLPIQASWRCLPHWSLEPIIQPSDRAFSKFACKAAFAAESRKFACRRPWDHKPCRRDPAALDDFRTLKHEAASASAESAAKPLQADEAGSLVVAQRLQRPNRRFPVNVSGKCLAWTNFHQCRVRALVVGPALGAMDGDLCLSSCVHLARSDARSGSCSTSAPRTATTAGLK